MSIQYSGTERSYLRACVFLLALGLGVSKSHLTYAQIDPLDSAALVALYNATGGDGWNSKINWLQTSPVDSAWEGVTVTFDAQTFAYRVTEIALPSNNLVGSLPDSVGLLTSLQTLDLSFNSLTGSIPTQLFSLAGLNSVNLSNNNLDGTIPTPSAMTSLVNLNLSANALTGSIPIEIGDLAALEILNLFENQFSGSIPAEIGALTNLQYLNLSNNQLSGGIPIEIGSLVSLNSLDLGTNLLTGGIPIEIGTLTSLTSLNLYSNSLSGNLPAVIWTLDSLNTLNLFINQFTGSIPEDIGVLTKLSTLQLTGNQFSGSLPVALGSLTNLTTLALSGNQFSGAVPAALSNLGSLTYLGLGDNLLTDLPDFSQAAWADSLLAEFSVYGNFFAFDDIAPNIGIPNFFYNGQKSIPAQPDLTVMEGDPFSITYAVGGTGNTYQWYMNGLPVGTDTATYSVAAAATSDENPYYLVVTNSGVPDLTLSTDQTFVTVLPGPANQSDSLALVTLYNATNGAGWNMQDNWLTSEVRNWHGVTVANGRVTSLDLAFNNLSGQLPAAIGDFDSLKFLNLSGNPIIDPLPVELGTLGALTYLGLGQNYNHSSLAELPSTIGNLSQLLTLDISWNRIELLPEEIGNLTLLQDLQLGGNMLTTLPDTLGNLTALRFLNIEGNQISSLPASMNQLTSLDTFFGAYNLLSSFPDFLQSSAGTLTTLFIQGNLFADLPADLNTFTTLQTLAIGSDSMTVIPTVVFGMSQLTSLYIYNSPLGTAPEDLTALANLNSLSLSGCSLTGQLPGFLATMPSLLFLDVSFNSLDSLPDFSGTTIENLRIAYNNLPFGEIEKVLFLPSVDYVEQNPLPAADEVRPLIGQELLIRIPVSGSANEYQWYKDEQPLQGFQTDSLFIQNVELADNGYYRLQITSTQVPDLILSTEHILVTATSPVSAADSLALVALFNSTGGTSWTNKEGWLQQGVPVANWHGVAVNEGRVTGLNLYYNELAGNIPPEIGNLTHLVELYLAGNQLTGDVPVELNNLDSLVTADLGGNLLVNLPDLTGMLSVTGLYVQDNHFTFEDLEPNIGIPGIYYNYQKSVPFSGSTEIILGDPLNLSVTVGGAGNVYQWMKEYGPIEGAVSDTYAVASATASDRGYYFLQITNPAVPDLVLRSGDIEVEILSPSYAYESGYIFWKKIGAEESGIFQHFPSVVALDGLGNIYALDKELQVINKFDASGNFIQSVSYLNDVPYVSDMEADAQGSLYVSDETSSRLVKYDAAGNFSYAIEYTDGTYGIAVGSTGDIYFLPRNYLPFKVRRHDGVSGSFIEEIELSGGPAGGPEAGIYLGFEMDAEGNIYLLEPSIGRLDKYSATGAFASAIDLVANGYSPWSGWFFTVTAAGDIYLQTNSGAEEKIYHFGSDGMLVSKFGDSTTLPAPGGIAQTSNGLLVGDHVLGLQLFDFSGTFLQSAGPQKNANGQFNQARQIAIDSQGNRYIADFHNGRVQKFDDQGTFLSVVGSPGTGTDQLSYPVSVAIDTADNIYVVDSGNNRIQKYSSEGTHLLSIGGPGAADGQFNNPAGVVISPTGFLYVLDAGNFRVQKLDVEGNHLLSFGSSGTGEGQFSNINSIAIEDDGTLLISDNHPSRWHRFNEDGLFLEEVYLGIDFVNAIATDNKGAIYVAGGDGIGKADKNGGLLTMIGTSEIEEQHLRQPLSVSSNAAGDTLWVSSSPNRVSIFYATEPDFPKLDSLVLVELYNATGGTGWTNNSGWLSTNITSWFGVTTVNGRVVELSLPNNDLTGNLPANLGQLGMLERFVINDNMVAGTLPESILQIDSLVHLDISNNALTALPDLSVMPFLGLLPGNELRLFGNSFQFDDLQPNATIPNISYSPQQAISAVAPVAVSELQPFSISYTIGGAGNTYQWFKDSIAIEGATNSTFEKASAGLTDAGAYFLTSTNSNVPGLTLSTAVATVDVSALSVSEAELAALTDLYNATQGVGWANNTNWLAEGQDVATWHGITVVEGKVQKIDLSANNLVGAIPASLANLSGLTELIVRENKLTELPDLSALPLTSFDVSTNELTFEDLEPNISILTAYNPQAKIPSGGNRSVTEEQELILQFAVGGESNSYQWFKNGEAVSGATATTFTVASAQLSNAGDYFLEVKNSTVADLVISSETISVAVNLRSANNADSLALVQLYNKTGGVGWTNRTNWLSAPVNSWYGVTVESGRVVAVVLPNNNLTGPLPQELFAMEVLRVLNLSGNNISGGLPETITGLRALQQLYLQDNQINSKIPTAFGNLTLLTALDLGRNKFYGTLPATLGNLTNLESILGAAGNDLVGLIPSSLGALTKLKVLALDDNQFEGTIPVELGNITALEQLYLHKNMLTGNVPSQLGSLANLQNLYLGENELEGAVPVSVGSMGALRQVVLNNNKFTFIPGFTAPLDTLNIAENKVGFGSVEPNMQVNNFVYAPQGKFGQPQDTLHNVGEDFTFVLNMDGSSNSYQWFKEELQVEGATSAEYTITQPDFANEGVYMARVINNLVPGLEIQTEDYYFKLSSIQRDSLALVAIFNETGGTEWINKENWLEGELSTWAGITVTNDRVTGIDLRNNKVVGTMPSALRDIGQLEVIDFSNAGETFDPAVDNQIREIPGLRRLTNLTRADFTRNRLGFTSIEPNYVNLEDKFVFSPQRRFGETRFDSIQVDTPHRIEINVSGSNNLYQWYFNNGKPGSENTAIPGATSRIYYVDTVAYESQGIYFAEVTSPLVPGFSIRNRNQNLTAVTSIKGVVNDVMAETPLSAGEVSLYMVRSGPYLNMGSVPVGTDGSYNFPKAPLAAYVLLARPDAVAFPDALLTYYSSTLDWAQADTLILRNPAEGVNINLLSIPPPLDGDGVIAGALESDVPDEELVDEESRVLTRKRVKGAGVSLSRQRFRGKGTEDDVYYEFVAHTVTDENGEFSFGSLPDDTYLINIQYPGVPMDQSSELLLTLGEDTDEDELNVAALVTPTGIAVNTVLVKGIPAPFIKNLVVYPNPGEDLVHLEYFVRRKVSGLNMRLSDVRGQTMMMNSLPFSRGEQKIILDLSSLASGLYLLTITDDAGTVKETFRIQRK